MTGGTNGTADRSPSPPVDVCVVGSGVAGGLVAHELARRGHDVVVLEAGPRFDPESRLERMERTIRPDIETATWDMGGERDRFSTSGAVGFGLNTRRVKGVGGSTLAWEGYTPRFHEKDFEMNSRYGHASDWPIDYRDLRPYYAEAERKLGVAGADDNPFGPPREEPYPLPAFPGGPVESLFEAAADELDITLHSAPQARNSEAYDGRSRCLGYSTCAPVCPSGAKYSGDVHVRKAEAAGARVIDRAPVQRLRHDAAGDAVEAAVYNTPERDGLEQEARRFVLACGGVETPRLLLLSRSAEYPDGLANSSGAVGRYFMNHPAIYTSGVIEKPDGQEPLYWWTHESYQFYDHDDPTPGSIKLEFKHGNPALAWPLTGFDEGVADELADPLVGETWSDDAFEAYAERVRSRWEVGVSAYVEVLPREENRVTLDPSRTDDHGNPVPDIVIDGVGSHAIETAKRAIDIQTDVLAELGASGIESTDPHDPRYAAHLMGTTRMGDDPDSSVVGPHLRTHDLRNLFVASASVFVTAGAMNPTLTIAALALRLADRLDDDL